MIQILTIIGARPQFIKAAAISHAIREKYANSVCEDILHTGQHYDDAMSGRFFTELNIPQPKYNLGVGSGNHGAQTAAMLTGIEKILSSEHYDGVLVYGDTNSTLAGALAASKLHIPVYHVEAGLRSFNRNMPEEINRILTDHVSTLLFAPTQTAVQNLQNEGFKENEIIFSGDVMYDNVLHYSPLSTFHFPFSTDFILATIHRDFNTDNPERLRNILSALNVIAEKYNTTILFPVHPRTRKKLQDFETSRLRDYKTFHFVEPLSYLETLAALQKARLVLTDSGGLQKEANFSGKCCVVLRPETEWVELVEDGAAILADADSDRILEATDKLIGQKPKSTNHFGDGHASEIIVKKIIHSLER